MNSDEISGMVQKIVSTLLTSTAMAAYLDGSQATALASAAGVLATLGYGVYAHWNMRKVPETSIVTSLAPTVAIAKSAGIEAAK